MKKNSKVLLCGLVIFVVSLIVSGITLAKTLTEEEIQIRSNYGVRIYDQCSTGGNSGGPCAANVSGKTIEEKIWSGLTAFLTDEQAAGVMGNMAHEGGFNPARHETTFIDSNPSFPIAEDTEHSYGIGLVQWSFKRRVGLYEFLKENGAEDLWTKYIDEGRETYGRLGGADFLKKADDAEVNTLIALELCYLKSELDGDPDGWGAVMKETTVDGAANTFLRTFEKPADMDGQEPKRKKRAQEYYKQFHGKATSGGGGDSSSDPSCNSCVEGSLNINGAAACMAHPLGSTKKDYKKSEGGKATPLEVEAAKKFDNADYIDAPWCSGFTALLVRWSGYDKKFTANMERGANKTTQADKANKKLWDVIDWDGDVSELQGGDIINCTAFDHSWVVIEDENGDFYQAEASVGNGEFGHIEKLGPSCKKGVIIRAKNAKNSSAGVSVTGNTKSSSSTGVSKASGKGNGDINASAIELAWPKGEGDPEKSATASFKKVFKSLKGGPGGGCWKNGKSCSVFVNTVLLYTGARNDGADKVDDVAGILDYMMAHPDDWEDVNGDGKSLKYSDLQGGDVLVYYQTSQHGGERGTKHEFKGAKWLQHIAFYIEDDKGGAIAEAAYCAYFGKIARKVKPDDKLGNLVRVFRWKKGNTDSSCNVCDGEDDSGGAGSLKEGGMTKAEAEKFMEAYAKEADKKKTGDYMFDGALVRDDGCPNGTLNNCVSFSQWFVNRYTTKGPKWNNTTNGVGLAKAMGSSLKLKTGDKPEAYSVFSKSGPSSAGHTGIILGVDTQNKKIITGEAACNDSSGVYTRPWVGEYSFDDVKGWDYAYLNEVLKSGEGL